MGSVENLQKTENDLQNKIFETHSLKLKIRIVQFLFNLFATKKYLNPLWKNKIKTCFVKMIVAIRPNFLWFALWMKAGLKVFFFHQKLS